jgi:hypothetical protein
MKFKSTIYFTRYFHFDSLTVYPTFPSKKNMYFVANLGLKELNCARKNQERNIKKN